MSFNVVLFAIKTSSALFHLYEILNVVPKALLLKKEPWAALLHFCCHLLSYGFNDVFEGRGFNVSLSTNTNSLLICKTRYLKQPEVGWLFLCLNSLSLWLAWNSTSWSYGSKDFLNGSWLPLEWAFPEAQVEAARRVMTSVGCHFCPILWSKMNVGLVHTQGEGTILFIEGLYLGD